uniref:Origin recognition complex subunit 2 n=1 Tax=Steinernema glaseri TaxID=37863 RepID=A0A1I8A3K7_9BILA
MVIKHLPPQEMEEPRAHFCDENPAQLHEDDFEELFRCWDLLLATGKFNILVNGLGSKVEELNSFVDIRLKDYPLVTVNGFMRSASARQVLDNIKEGFKMKCSSGGSTLEYAKRVAEELKTRKQDLVVLVHNIDGAALRDSTQQRVLALLASCETVRMIASVDHVNAPIMWDDSLLSQFKWASFNMTTRKPYVEELMHSDVRLLDGDTPGDEGAHTLASMNAMWASLTQNAQNIFCYLMRLVCKKDEKAVPMIELFEAAREDFLVSSMPVLKQQLVEFVDHNIITRKTNNQGDEDVVVTANIALLKQFLESKGCKLSSSDDEESDEDDA